MTVKMRAEARDLWVEALESGRYTQASGGLRSLETGGFCCLGVLCEVARNAGLGVSVDLHENDDYDHDFAQYDTESSYLPASVVEWAGLVDDADEAEFAYNPVLTEPVSGRSFQASDWNDDMGAGFAEIAEMVRAIPAVDQ